MTDTLRPKTELDHKLTAASTPVVRIMSDAIREAAHSEDAGTWQLAINASFACGVGQLATLVLVAGNYGADAQALTRVLKANFAEALDCQMRLIQARMGVMTMDDVKAARN